MSWQFQVWILDWLIIKNKNKFIRGLTAKGLNINPLTLFGMMKKEYETLMESNNSPNTPISKVNCNVYGWRLTIDSYYFIFLIYFYYFLPKILYLNYILLFISHYLP